MSSDPGKLQRFECAIEGNRKRLLSIARSYASGDDCRDLYQDILCEIWQHFDSYSEKSGINTWVYRVALNVASTFKSKALRRVEHSAQLDESTAAYEAGTADHERQIAILADFMDSLDSTDRAIFQLYLDNLNYHEMAEITRFNEAYLRVRISRLKKKFADRYI